MRTGLTTSAVIATFAFVTGFAVEPQTGSGTDDGYRLVWQELFDADELNPLRWDIEVNGDGGGNNELQYYTDRPENVRLGDDGEGNRCLILTARRENYKGKSFTSGRLTTKNRIAFTHGKIEASIKIPSTSDGLWPAFWMMGNDYDNVGWPRCGEIDIVEMGNSDGIRNGLQDKYFNGACHWGPAWPNASYAQATTKAYSLQDGEFHLFTMIWDEKSIKMYVDLDKIPVQNPYYSIDIPVDDPNNEWSPGNYFHKDNFILFNLAVGGNFTGIHDPGKITALNEENGQEASMYINYLRIYQKGDTTEHQAFLDPGDFDTNILPEMFAENDGISFEGSRLRCEKPGIRVYNLEGEIIMHTPGREAEIDCLEPGIYLIQNIDKVKKIVLH